MYNAGERKDVRRAEKAAKIIETNRGEIIRSIASTAAGRAYLWERLSTAHIFATSYSNDALQMAFNEGERNQGLLLLNDIITHCPEQFILAMREHNERRTDPPSERTGSPNGDGRVEGSADSIDGDEDRAEG